MLFAQQTSQTCSNIYNTLITETKTHCHNLLTCGYQSSVSIFPLPLMSVCVSTASELHPSHHSFMCLSVFWLSFFTQCFFIRQSSRSTRKYFIAKLQGNPIRKQRKIVQSNNPYSGR